jgi:uncharacterized SAM-binding protein YcdF (DUF218 family)
MFHRLARLVVVIVLIAITAVFCYGGYTIQSFSQVDETRSADVAIVLGAATYRNRPSPVFTERINHAIELYQRGWVKAIILTGGYGSGDVRADSEIARDYAIQRGIPESAIHIETVSTTTEENLAEAQHLMQNLGFETALVVSDPLHMYRSLKLAGELGIQAFSSPTKTSRYRTLRSQLFFLARESYLFIQDAFAGL